MLLLQCLGLGVFIMTKLGANNGFTIVLSLQLEPISHNLNTCTYILCRVLKIQPSNNIVQFVCTIRYPMVIYLLVLTVPLIDARITINVLKWAKWTWLKVVDYR